MGKTTPVVERYVSAPHHMIDSAAFKLLSEDAHWL
jgi:hypothetical protein